MEQTQIKPDWATSWISFGEVVELFGGVIFTRYTLRKKALEGTLPFRVAQFNGRWYAVRSEVENYKAEVEQKYLQK